MRDCSESTLLEGALTETTCPLCGEESLQTMQGTFRFDPPPNIPGGTMIIPNATWQHCTACNEDIIPYELDQAIDREHDRRLGLPDLEKGLS